MSQLNKGILLGSRMRLTFKYFALLTITFSIS